jgi:hypothetical protein
MKCSPHPICAIGAIAFFGSCSSRPIRLLWVAWLLEGSTLVLAFLQFLCFHHSEFDFFVPFLGFLLVSGLPRKGPLKMKIENRGVCRLYVSSCGIVGRHHV